jgi:hypothetical protein
MELFKRKGKKRQDDLIETEQGQPEQEEPVKTLNLSYELTYDEIYEALLMIVDKRSRKSRYIVSVILCVIAAILVVQYAMDMYAIQYAFLGLVSALLAFLVIWYQPHKAKRGAKKISKLKGTYKIKLSSDGYITPYGADALAISGDKDCRAFETDTIFALRMTTVHNFCFPKRAMNSFEINLTREILQKYARKYFDQRTVKN